MTSVKLLGQNHIVLSNGTSEDVFEILQLAGLCSMSVHSFIEAIVAGIGVNGGIAYIVNDKVRMITMFEGIHYTASFDTKFLRSNAGYIQVTPSNFAQIIYQKQYALLTR